MTLPAAVNDASQQGVVKFVPGNLRLLLSQSSSLVFTLVLLSSLLFHRRRMRHGRATSKFDAQACSKRKSLNWMQWKPVCS